MRIVFLLVLILLFSCGEDYEEKANSICQHTQSVYKTDYKELTDISKKYGQTLNKYGTLKVLQDKVQNLKKLNAEINNLCQKIKDSDRKQAIYFEIIKLNKQFNKENEVFKSWVKRLQTVETRYKGMKSRMLSDVDYAEYEIKNAEVELDKLENHYEKKYAFNKTAIEKKADFYRKELKKLKEKIKYIKADPDRFLNYDFIIKREYWVTPYIVKQIKKEIESVFGELDKEKFVILKGKKVEYHAVFSIYYWDSWDDWDNTAVRKFDVVLPKSEYDKLVYFVTKEDGWNRRFCSDTWGCYYKEFNDLARAMFKRVSRVGDDSFEIYIENLYPAYYHTYLIIENGSQKMKTEQVDEDEWKAYPKIGMLVIAKPRGYFSDQIDPNPINLDKYFLGNPIYGHEVRRNGHSFWEFYGKYRFLEDILSINRGLYRYKPVLDEYEDVYYGKRVVIASGGRRKTAASRGGYSVRGAGSRYRGGGFGGGGK